MRIAGVSSTGFEHLDHAELEKHVRFIESLAEEMQRSVEDIVPLYEEVLESLAGNVQVNDYLPIFVCKRVKRILSRRSP
ncbi:DUF3562 domain-containing protein [Herbaspirillum sp. HC18]|nr:DUF3562 domain-containing protein [Herbaspirillum sp. HC18]